MARARKLLCHDCDTIFNKDSVSGRKGVCWKCGSTRVTGVNDAAPPPAGPVIPAPPAGAPPVFAAAAAGGGGLTAAMLAAGRAKLKKVVPKPVVLPGAAQSPIPRGIRLLAHGVKATTIYTSTDPQQNGIVRDATIELDVPWRDRGRQYMAHLIVPSVDLSVYLTQIASGIPNPAHHNANSAYGNRSLDLPARKRNRNNAMFSGISYREYGWRRPVNPTIKWAYYHQGLRYMHSAADNAKINQYLQGQGGTIFCERIIIAESGEVFYTPDHYITFFRYHPGTRQWHWYRSTAGAGNPGWDASYYDEKVA